MPGSVRNVKDPSTWGPIYNVTAQKGQLVLDAAAAAGREVDRIYGYNVVPDHSNKQCIDYMHYGKSSVRLWLESFLRGNKAALGVEGIISDHRVMGFPSQGPAYRGPEGAWRPYSGPSPHTDHVHAQTNTVGALVPPTRPSKPVKPAKAWTGKLCVLKTVPAYDGSGKRRADLDLKAGQWVTGTVDDQHFDDGRYLRVGKIPHRVWFPLDNGHWSHEKAGQPIGEGGRSTVSTASVSAIAKAARLDPGRKQGGTTAGSADDVKVVEDALQRAGYLSRKYAADGSFGTATVAAYAKWQRRLGYRGRDADGVPGADSLTKLGRKFGFDVTK